MVRLTRIYTRGGDKGETSLVGGKRVPKYGLRVAAYGAVDEANAALGLARLHAPNETGRILDRIQNDLFDVGADLATPLAGRKAKSALRIAVAQTVRLEREIDALNTALAPLESFVLPGGTPFAAALHLARTAVRRAERAAAALAAKERINPETLKYLNRLSDLLFVLARHANDLGRADVLWIPGANG